MKFFKLKIIRIGILLFIVTLLITQSSILTTLFRPSTAYAIGDLTVNWGVPEGNPIFTVTNMAPGQSQEHDVTVHNAATSSRPLGIKGIKTDETGGLGSVLDITIFDGVTILYTNTLSQFFTDSLNPDGIALNNINPGQTKTYKFKVTFRDSAGNDFQDKHVLFNIILGIAIPIPSACSNIDLTNKFPIFGTQNNDAIHGTSGDDVIFGLEGNDKIYGGGGNDCIIGGVGNDTLRGETGNDILFGNEGNDTLIGGVGNDTAFGGIGNDTIRGEAGNDILSGEEGNDNILGGDGNDTINGGAGNDFINGESGDDMLHGNTGNDTLIGGAGADTLLGDDDLDNANGQSGTDSCSAETKTSCEIVL